MSTEEGLNNWLEIQDLVKKDFFHVITRRELVKLIKVLDVDIPGFTKRIDTAPFPMLKNGLINHLRRMPLEGFFRTFARGTYEELKDEEYEQGIKKIASNNELENSEVIALLGTLYPKKYKELREDFIENLDDPNNILSNVIDLKNEDIFQSIIKNHRRSIKKIYQSLDWPNIDHDLELLQTHFRSEYNLDFKTATTLFFTDKINDLEFTDEERYLLYELAIFELLKNHSKNIVEIAELNKGREEKDKSYRDLTKEMERVKTNQERKIIEIKEQHEKNIKHKDQLINYLKQQKEMISNQHVTDEAKLQQKIDSLQEQLDNEQKVPSYILNESDQIMFFTDRVHEYEKLDEKGLLKELNELEKYVVEKDNERIIFIDVFGMSTQKRRAVRKLTSGTKHSVKLVNGTPVSIIRNIIYHIEGVGLN